MLRDRGPAHVEVRRDVAGRPLGVPHQAQDLPSPGRRDRLQQPPCSRCKQRLTGSSTNGRRNRPGTARSTMPSAIRLRVAEPIARDRGSASASALADRTRGTPTTRPGPGALPRREAGAGRTACRPAGGPEPAHAFDRTLVAPRCRPARDATEVHQRLVPRARVSGGSHACAVGLEARPIPRRAPRRARRGRRSGGRWCRARPPAHRARSKRRPRLYGPTPKPPSSATSRGTRPPWSRTIARAASWSAIARRLYPRRPTRAGRRRARPGRARRRPGTGRRTLEDRLDASSLRLLEHHLRDQGAVQAPAAPRVRVAPRPVPAEDRRAQRRDAHAQNPGLVLRRHLVRGRAERPVDLAEDLADVGRRLASAPIAPRTADAVMSAALSNTCQSISRDIDPPGQASGCLIRR